MADEAEKQAREAAAQKPPEDARPGYWRRSELWDFEDAIRKRVAERRSYPQILDALKRLGLRQPIGVRRLAQFCVEQLGIHSLRPSRHDQSRGDADKKSASAVPAAPPAPVSSGPVPNGARLADAYGPEAADPLAGLRPSTPRSNP